MAHGIPACPARQPVPRFAMAKTPPLPSYVTAALGAELPHKARHPEFYEALRLAADLARETARVEARTEGERMLAEQIAHVIERWAQRPQ